MAVLPSGLCRFGHFLALTVPSAVGFRPRFLYAAAWPKKRPLRHAATRRHRTQYLLNFTVTDSISEIQANVNNATTRVFHIRPWHYNSISILRRALFARI